MRNANTDRPGRLTSIAIQIGEIEHRLVQLYEEYDRALLSVRCDVSLSAVPLRLMCRCGLRLEGRKTIEAHEENCKAADP